MASMAEIRFRSTELKGLYERDFPGLKSDPDWKITSDPSDRYNCFAWAAKEKHRNWGPMKGYWPEACERHLSVESVCAVFATLGYAQDRTELSAQDVERVAIFSQNEVPTHVALQLASGLWTSKLGENHDIQHRLESLCGDLYGNVRQILEQPREKAQPEV